MISSQDDTDIDGQTVRSADSLEGALGWCSAAVFEAGQHCDGDQLKVNKTTEIIVLTDPWPEYKKFVYRDGMLEHTSAILSSNYEMVFEQNIKDYGSAEIVNLNELPIERDEKNIPQVAE